MQRMPNLISWGMFSLNAPIRLSRRARPYLYNNWLNSGSGYPWRTVASNQPNFGFLSFNAGQHWNYLVIVMDRNVARSLLRSRSRQTRPSIPPVLRASFSFFFFPSPIPRPPLSSLLWIWFFRHMITIPHRISAIVHCFLRCAARGKLVWPGNSKKMEYMYSLFGMMLEIYLKNVSCFSLSSFCSYEIYWFCTLAMKIIIIIIPFGKLRVDFFPYQKY